MEKRIYDYIKEKKVVSIHDVSEHLNLPEISVLKSVEELRRKRFLKMCTPVPLSISNNESCFYTTTSKVYQTEVSVHQP